MVCYLRAMKGAVIDDVCQRILIDSKRKPNKL